MSDVKDILGVSRAAGTPAAEVKPKKEKMKRPEGMSREAFALLGDSHPIISTQLVVKKKDMKAKPKPSTKGFVTWSWKPIASSARTDDLKVFHWCKGYKDAAGRMKEPDDTDYHYAKFNKKVQLLKYNDEEYDHLIKPDSGDWSRPETDYLMDLCERFDLRFMVIHDRYEYTPPPGIQPAVAPARTLDDLKERYYTIARRLLIAREGGEAPVANHVLVKTPFNKTAELERKKAIEMVLQRTPQQTLEENAVLAEARVLEERWRAENQRRAAAAAAANPVAAAANNPQAMAAAIITAIASGERQLPDSFSNDTPPNAPSLYNMTLEASKPPKPGVYPRGGSVINLAATMAAALPGGPKAQKNWETVMADPQWLGAFVPPRCATRAVCGAWLAMRQELLGLQELKRQVGPRPGQGGGDAGRQKRKR